MSKNYNNRALKWVKSCAHSVSSSFDLKHWF